MAKTRIYTWQEFDRDVYRILLFIEGRGKKYKGIYPIPLGGLVLGVSLAYELNIPLVYGGLDSDILIVDEICDTGNTLSHYIKKGYDTIVLHKRQGNGITPKFWAEDVARGEWIMYPWDKEKCSDGD